MPVELILAPEVEQDLDDAYAWYEAQRRGLGEEFLGCVTATVQALRRSPRLYAKVHGECRRALVRRFPFGVFFAAAPTAVTVLAILHTSRRPEEWQKRVDNRD
jgi:plasmid stabilization system protein ParE